MKQNVLGYCLNLISDTRPDIDDIKLDEIRYGLEAIYITLTKTVVIFTLAIILNIFKEMFLLLLFFNILRTTGFGLHATKGWICLLSSSLIFIFLPFISKIITIPLLIKSLLGIGAIILVFIYAPADTIKRPIINKNRRAIYKSITTISCIILSFLSIMINDNTLSNLIIFGIYIEIILILPITYKMFNLSYNNYLNYIN